MGSCRRSLSWWLQRAEAAERDLTKLKLLAYMADRIGEEMLTTTQVV